jgi:hypothetical protein
LLLDATLPSLENGGFPEYSHFGSLWSMSSTPEPPRRPPWRRLQFSLGNLFWLMVVTGMVLVWWKDRSSLDKRLRTLEQMYSPSSQSMWGAAEVLGAPDDPSGTAGKSWCPWGSRSADWIEVGFDKAVAAATIDLYETYSVGCVTEVIVIDRNGRETTIWKGTDPTPPTARVGLFQVPVPKSIKSVERVKIHVDTTLRGSWACLDAVGLSTAAGNTTWATSSNCSSVYGSGSLTATSTKRKWLGFW